MKRYILNKRLNKLAKVVTKKYNCYYEFDKVHIVWSFYIYTFNENKINYDRIEITPNSIISDYKSVKKEVIKSLRKISSIK